MRWAKVMTEQVLWDGRLYRQARLRLPAALAVNGLLPSPALWRAPQCLGFELADGSQAAACLARAGAGLDSRGCAGNGQPLLHYRLWQSGAGQWKALSAQGWALWILPAQHRLWLCWRAVAHHDGHCGAAAAHIHAAVVH